MKERPILFSAPMVRALLAGTKTQTRRVVKGVQPWGIRDGRPEWAIAGTEPRCPYGQPGDRLWVREAWQAELRWDWTPPRDIAASSPIYFEFGDEAVPACAGRNRPSIHMPRWASRITLEVADVRVERLQSISEADAIAEGIESNAAWPGGFYRNYMLPDDGDVRALPPRESYQTLWESINGSGSWEANPWVWAVSFRGITP